MIRRPTKSTLTHTLRPYKTLCRSRMSQSREAVGQDVRYRMIEPPVVANRPVGPDRALFLSAVLVLSIVAGLGGGMILVLLDTSFSSLTELRDYTGLRVLGAISDAR